MLELSKHPSLKYILFGVLYFSEGLIYALASVIIVLFFTDKDISISTTALVGGIVSSPWILKFIMGPTVDFFGKYGRKIFIIIGGVVGAISIFIAAFVDPSSSMVLFTLLLFIGHAGVILLDVSADAWAIQTTSISDRGKVNAAMSAGIFLGIAFGGILLAFIATYFGFEMVFITAAVLISLSILLPLYVKEDIIQIKKGNVKPLLLKEFKKRNTQIVILLLFILGLNFGMLRFIIPEYMTNVLILDKIQTGLLTSIYYILIIIGAVFGGFIADKWGRKKISYITLAGLLISLALLVFADTWEKLGIIYGIIGFMTGASSYSAIAALMMDITNPKVGASQYSIMASIGNLGMIGISMISGSLIIILGYSKFFLYAALTVGLSLLILYFVKETHKKDTC